MRTLYVYLGEDILVKATDIIAILDKETVKASKDMEALLENSNHEMFQQNKGAYKSIVITGNKVYYSPLASATLKKRSTMIQEF
ncbi:extracellular matrix regulator RemB [Robertmurraya andreesenii]|uniref:extracellular matrix regulator RemB n=1 Tax=Anoxybacillus andreesenii TaxID=1325932 RepID=UPI0027D8AFCC|nr:extracellular matrix/biofilm biosynthesis regulator RemA family protein [Robertmurraya andreesenii]